MASNHIQRILWTISGAETKILESENCRTDHKRFAAIGATIAITTFIAFLSGTSAAWYFTQRGAATNGNIGWAMAFGLVWATLIFCIDRSLVITLKKNPDTPKAYWWVFPLLTRAALATLIAFMVSIPLELVVFEDFIAEQKFYWNENKSNTLATNSLANKESLIMQEYIDEGNASILRMEKQKDDLEAEKSNLNGEIGSLRAKLNNPTTKAYKDARNGLSAANTAINQLNKRISNLNYQYNNADQYSKSGISNQISKARAELKFQFSRKASFNSIIQSEIRKWNEPINKKIAELQSEVESKESEISQKKQDINTTTQRKNENEKKRDDFNSQKETVVNEHKSTLNKGNHFIQNFEILEYAVSNTQETCPTCKGIGKIKGTNCSECLATGKVKGDLPLEWYFLTLIRLLFFIIELLPTVVKIVMPIGPYERMVAAEEKDVEMYLNSSEYLGRIRSMHELEIKAHEDQVRAQISAEEEIRNALMDKLKLAQIEIVEKAIQKWRESEISKYSDDYSKPTIRKDKTDIPDDDEIEGVGI